VEVRGQNHTPAALPILGEHRGPMKNGTVDPRADRNVMEKKKSVAPAGGGGGGGIRTADRPFIIMYVV
jgi:hypothetical protein